MFLQVTTAEHFIATVETLTGRTVHAFASATDPDHGVVATFTFEPEHRRDGRPPPASGSPRP
jgi:hypothetical protein